MLAVSNLIWAFLVGVGSGNCTSCVGTAVNVGDTAIAVEASIGDGDGGTGVVVAVDVGEADAVGDGDGVNVGKLVGVTVGWGSRGGSPSGGSPPSRDCIK